MEKKKKPAIRFKGFTDSWEQRKLGELGEIMTGSTPSTSKSEYYSEDGIPWVTPTDINSQTISDTPRKLSGEGIKVGRVVPANTILCTCIASIGKNTLLTVKGSFNQQINCLTPNEYNDAYFLLTECSLAADVKPADKRNYELQQQISYNVIIPPEAFETSADGTLIVPIEIKTDDKGNIVAVEAGPNNWKLDREAYPIFEEAAKEAAWNTKHVDTDEALVVTIPVSIVMLSDNNLKKG